MKLREEYAGAAVVVPWVKPRLGTAESQTGVPGLSLSSAFNTAFCKCGTVGSSR